MRARPTKRRLPARTAWGRALLLACRGGAVLLRERGMGTVSLRADMGTDRLLRQGRAAPTTSADEVQRPCGVLLCGERPPAVCRGRLSPVLRRHYGVGSRAAAVPRSHRGR